MVSTHEGRKTVGGPSMKLVVYDCPKCGGWGWIDRDNPRDCDNCNGTGLVKNVVSSLPKPTESKPCS